MQTVRSQLFEGITNEECARMFQCFGAREAGYEAGALISEFDGEQNAVGVLLSGSADLVRLDADGTQRLDAILRRLGFQLSSRGDIGHQRQMDIAAVVGACPLQPHLADGFQTPLRLLGQGLRIVDEQVGIGLMV